MERSEEATEMECIRASQETCEGKKIEVEYIFGVKEPVDTGYSTTVNVRIFDPSYGRRVQNSLNFSYLLKTSTCNEELFLHEPLLWACSYRVTRVVEVLIGYGACIIRTNSGHESAFYHACLSGSLDIVKALTVRLASECDPSVSIDKMINHNDWTTPLLHASARGHLSMVNYLINNGADVCKKDVFGSTPLHHACSAGFLEVVKVLVARGGPASVHVKNIAGETALHWAVHGKGAEGLVEYLLMMGAEINVTDNIYGQTALHFAAKITQKGAVDVLLAHGADVNARNFDGKCPLYVAHGLCYRQSSSEDSGYIVRTLLQHGADADTPYSNELPLSLIEGDYSDIILLDYGMGSGVACHCPSCSSDTTQLMCLYRKARIVLSEYRARHPHSLIDILIDPHADIFESLCISCFERHFIKCQTAGISREEEKAADPPEPVDWSQSRRDAYQSECEAELRKAKIQLIPNTTATYHDLLTRNLPCLRDQIIRSFNFDACLRAFPIYGDMMSCSYVRLQRFFLLNQTAAIFYLTEHQLPPECSRQILSYLPNEDLCQLLNMIQVRLILTARRARKSDDDSRKRAASVSHGSVNDETCCCTPECSL